MFIIFTHIIINYTESSVEYNLTANGIFNTPWLHTGTGPQCASLLEPVMDV